MATMLSIPTKNEAFTVYCDFNSEPPFVWTLIESFSRDMSTYRSTLPGHVNFQRPFYYNMPYSQCRPDQWQHYRLSKRPCVQMDYINIRGTACRRCQIPMWFATTNHPSVISSLTQNYCGHVKFPNAAGSPYEYNFGMYNGYNREFSCTRSGESSTNWSFGDIYIPTNHFANVK
ncbi:uncharacterized protein TRIADDRAFT_59878 [Trichoplax adhaerens]|uniref:Uncharacterized protein n=1 Tax=Trichoplax adhaerens TaxID=10228 RepID=B3S6P4_TRIAD|nr:predicted protein [Trichoplax adhaerens]EDV21794.1 predicted protein [Trichoplax adhaerens]|eukprot:XP_002115942.1 predicted protein [Trichoplax adhaerens]